MAPVLAGLALGAVATGVSAISRASQLKQQRAAAAQAQNAQAFNNNMAIAQTQQQNQLFTQQQDFLNQQRQQDLAKVSADLTAKKVDNVDALRGLDTIYTSPLGDLSEPSLGRKKLLGN